MTLKCPPSVLNKAKRPVSGYLSQVANLTSVGSLRLAARPPRKTSTVQDYPCRRIVPNFVPAPTFGVPEKSRTGRTSWI